METSSSKAQNSIIYQPARKGTESLTGSVASSMTINPGVVQTEGTHAQGIPGSDLEKQLTARTPLGRIGQPRDIAPVAVLLASAESGWLTGQILLASGGLR